MTQLNHRQFIIDTLLERDGQSCAVCHELFQVYAPPTIDHKTPIMGGGAHAWQNLQLVHAVCNNRKGAKPWKPDTTSQREARKRLSASALIACNQNKEAAAASLKISLRTFYRWIK